MRLATRLRTEAFLWECMVNLIPPRSQLLTSEEQMLPILRNSAECIGTSLQPIG
ncbi:hypothetical protein [Halochromatium sp.]